MYKINNKLKIVVFSTVLAVGILLPTVTSAQMIVRHGGLFGYLDWSNLEEEEKVGMLRYNEGYGNFNIFPEQFDQSGNGEGVLNISTQQFDPNNNEAPLGSGLFILAVTGAGYALKKRKNSMKQ